VCVCLAYSPPYTLFNMFIPDHSQTWSQILHIQSLLGCP